MGSLKFVNGPLEHERQTRDALASNSAQLDDVVTTSKAVSWPKVRNWILRNMSHVDRRLMHSPYLDG